MYIYRTLNIIMLLAFIFSFSFFMATGCSKADGKLEVKTDNHQDEHDHLEGHSHDDGHVHEHDDEGGQHIEHGDKAEGGIILSEQAIEDAGIVVERLSLRLLNSIIELPGTLLPHPEGEGFVGSLVDGRIHEVFADIGDRVSEGEPLCIIESPTVGEAEAAYITTQAELLFVKADLERHKTLVSEGIGSMKEQLELEARLAAASSAVSAAERTLHAYGFNEEDVLALQTNQHSGGRITLRSPISGVIVSRDARKGMQVATETDLFHVVYIQQLRVQLNIPEQQISGLAVGKDVTIITQNGHLSELKGRIERIGRSIDHETRTVTAFATVDNSSGALRPGAFVTIRLDQEGDGHEALVVPLDAVFKDEHGDQALFVEVGTGEFVVREVETGARAGNLIELTSGIAVGERVVTKGAFAIKSEADKSKFGDGHNH